MVKALSKPEKKSGTDVPEAPKDTPRGNEPAGSSRTGSSHIGCQVPTVRVYAVLHQALAKPAFKVCIGANHLGWTSQEGALNLEPVGTDVFQGHLFFAEIPVPPSGQMVFKIGQDGPWWWSGRRSIWFESRARYWSMSNIYGNRIEEVPREGGGILVVVVDEEFHQGEVRLQEGELRILTLLALNGLSTTLAEWDKHVSAAERGFGLSVNSTWAISDELAVRISTFYQQLAKESGPAEAVLRMLRTLSPRLIRLRFPPVVAVDMLQQLGKHCSDVKAFVAHSEHKMALKSTSYTSALADRFAELKDAVLKPMSPGAVCLAWNVHLSKLCINDSTSTYEDAAKFMREDGLKLYMQENYPRIVMELLKQDVISEDVMPLVVFGAASFHDVASAIGDLHTAGKLSPSVGESLSLCIKERIGHPEGWKLKEEIAEMPQVGHRVRVCTKQFRGQIGEVTKVLGRTGGPPTFKVLLPVADGAQYLGPDKIEVVEQVGPYKFNTDEVFDELNSLLERIILPKAAIFLEPQHGPDLLLAILDAKAWQLRGEKEVKRAAEVILLMAQCFAAMGQRFGWPESALHRKKKGLERLLQGWLYQMTVQLEPDQHICGKILEFAIFADNHMMQEDAKEALRLLPSNVFCSNNMQFLFQYLPQMSESLLDFVVRHAKEGLRYDRHTNALAHLRVYIEPIFTTSDRAVGKFCQAMVEAMFRKLKDANSPPPNDPLHASLRAAVTSPDAWQYLFQVLSRAESQQLGILQDPVFQEVAQCRRDVGEAAHRLFEGAMLLNDFRAHANRKEPIARFSQQDPGDFLRAVDAHNQRLHNIETLERTLDNFWSSAAIHNSALLPMKQALQIDFHTAVQERRSIKDVREWHPFPLAELCAKDLEFGVRAANSRIAMHLWRKIGDQGRPQPGQQAAEQAEEWAVLERAGGDGPLSTIHRVVGALRKDLETLMVNASSGQVSNDTIHPFIRTLQEGLPKASVPDANLNMAQAKAFAQKQLLEARKAVRAQAEDELRAIMELIPEVGGKVKSIEDLVNFICQCYDMWHARSKVKAFHSLVNHSKMKEILDAKVHQGSQYRALDEFRKQVETFDDNTIDSSLVQYLSFQKEVPAIQEVSEDVLLGLNEALCKGLMAELVAFESNSDFVNFRDRFLAQASRGTEEDVMLSFQRVREAMSNVVYGKPQGKPSDLQDLLLELNSLIPTDLRVLVDLVKMIYTVRLNSGTMEGITALENTVNLLSRGSFVVELRRNDAVSFHAEMPVAAGSAKEEGVLTQSEIFERRNQLAMAEIPVDVADMFDLSEQAPDHTKDLESFLAEVTPESNIIAELVHRADLRALVVQRFSTVVSQVVLISEEVTALRDMGHVFFQEWSLTSKASLHELSNHLNKVRKCQKEWQDFQLEAKQRLPLLRLFSPKQQMHFLNAVMNLADRKSSPPALVAAFSAVHRVANEEVADALGSMRASSKTPETNLSKALMEHGAHLMKTLLAQHLARKLSKRSLTDGLVHQQQPPKKLVDALAGLKFGYGKTVQVMAIGAYDDMGTSKMRRDRMPELICLVYYLHMKRLPAPFEILQCNAWTSEHELMTFLDRWVNSAAFAKEFRSQDQNGPPLLFCLANAQQLPIDRQAQLHAHLQRLQQEQASAGPPMPLTVLLCAPEKGTASPLANIGAASFSLVGSVLAAPGVTDTMVHRVVRERIAKCVDVYTSPHPCSGKTRSIRLQAKAKKLLYCTFSVTRDLQGLKEKLTAVQADREKLCPHRGLALHFNIAHDADFTGFNDFLFTFLFMGHWEDREGALHVWREDIDHVFFEIPSEGCPRSDVALARLPLCRALQKVDLDPHVRVTYPLLQPFRGSEILYEVDEVPDRSMRRAALWLDCFNRHKDSFSWPDLAPEPTDMPCTVDQPVDLDVDRVLHQVMEDKDNGIRDKFDKAEFRMFQRVRLLKFLGPQFERLAVRDAAVKDALDAQELQRFRMLRWLLVRVMVRTAATVAVSAVPPAELSDPGNLKCLERDHVKRFASVTTFEKTSHNFVVVSDDGEVDIISLSRENLMVTLTREYPPKFKDFTDWLRLQGFDKVANPARHLREQLLGMESSRKRIWELFGAKKPLALTADMRKLQKCHGENAAVAKDVAQHLQEMEVPGESPTPGRLANPLIILQQAEKMKAFYQQPEYTVTPESLIRILHIQYRLSAGLPVFVLGETGCGKTFTIRFLTRMLGASLTIINVHGAMLASGIWKELAPAVEKAKDEQNLATKVGRDPKWVYVFMDESNSTPDTWAVKECVCDGVCEGRALPPNLCIISAINPTRLKPEGYGAGAQAGLDGGVDCHAYYEQLQREEGSSQSIHEQFAQSEENKLQASFHETVYPVYPVPESTLSLMWDFGNPATNIWLDEKDRTGAESASQSIAQRTTFIAPVSDESIQVEALVNRIVEFGYQREDCSSQNFPALSMWLTEEMEKARIGVEVHWKAARTIITQCVLQAQRFVRDIVHKGDSSSVSLRDISRCVNLIPWLLNVFGKRRKAEAHLAVERCTERKKLPRCSDLQSAFVISLIHCYAMRLNTRKDEFRQEIISAWDCARRQFERLDDEFLPIPEGAEFWQPHRELTGFICHQLHLETGIARNDAVRENSFALFAGICTGTATFIVGKPGTSKSLSLDLLTGMMLNREHPFWGQFPVIHKKVFQCDPLVTPESIILGAEQVGRVVQKQMRTSDEEQVGVYVLEEMGVLALSQHNPLMSLHALVDRGIEVDGQFVKPCIIGISNWRVDPAKMNRGIFIFRGDPTPEDLQLTGKQIVLGAARSADDESAVSSGTMGQLSQVLRALATIVSQTIIRDPRYSFYYGLRDYYGLVKFLQAELAHPLSKEIGTGGGLRGANTITLHTVRWALARNLSTLPEAKDQKEPGRFQNDLVEAIERALVDADRHREQPAEWEFSKSRQAYCSTCARAAVRFGQRTRRGQQGATCHPLDRRARQTCQSPHPVPVLEQIAWNLEDSKARYLMLITEDSQALPLLFSTGLAQYESSTVICGSEFREDSDDATTLRQLQRVQTAMRLGQLLVLVQCRRIYENLLDMTNQHHLEEHGRRYTRLSMQAHSRYFPVHDRFRCVILVEQGDVRSLPPPFLNRFEKAVLTYDTILDPSHQQVLGSLRDHLRGARGIDFWTRMLPGFSLDTLASLAFTVTKHGDDTTDTLQIAVYRAAFAARYRTMLCFWCGDLAEISEACRDVNFKSRLDELLYNYFTLQPHGSLKSVLIHGKGRLDGAQISEDEDAEKLDRLCPWGDELGMHLVILTEQHPSMWQAQRLHQECRGLGAAANVLALDQVTSESSISRALQRFYNEPCESKSEAYLFLLCPSHIEYALLHKTFFLCSDERRRFMSTMVPGAQYQKRHVVFILRANETSNYKLHFDEHWHWVFLDCIFSATVPGVNDVSLDDLINRPLVATDKEGADKEPLLSADEGIGILSIRGIIRQHLPVIVSTTKYSSDMPGINPRALEEMQKRSKERVGKFDALLRQEESPAIRALWQRLLDELVSDERMDNDKWLAEALKYLDTHSSTRESLGKFLSEALVSVFKELLPLVDQNDNLQLAADKGLAELWAQLLQTPFVSGSPGGGRFTQSLGHPPAAHMVRVGQPAPGGRGAAQQPGQGPALSLQETIEELHIAPSRPVRFPFSSSLGERIFSLRAQGDRLQKFLVEVCPILMTLDSEQLELFASDILAGAFPDAAQFALDVVLAFVRAGGALDDCASLFHFIWGQERKLVQLFSLVSELGEDNCQQARSQVDHLLETARDAANWNNDGAGESQPVQDPEAADDLDVAAPAWLLLASILRTAMSSMLSYVVVPGNIAKIRDVSHSFQKLWKSAEPVLAKITAPKDNGHGRSYFSETEQQLQKLHDEIVQLWPFLDYAVTLRCHLYSATDVQDKLSHHLQHLVEQGSARQPLFDCFLDFLHNYSRDQSILLAAGQGDVPWPSEDAIAVSKCIAPIARVALGPPRIVSKADHRAGPETESAEPPDVNEAVQEAQTLLAVLVGTHASLEHEGKKALYLGWALPAQTSVSPGVGQVELTYAAASCLATRFVELFESAICNNLALAEQLCNLLALVWARVPGNKGTPAELAVWAGGQGDEGPLAQLLAQTWADRLGCIASAQGFHRAVDKLQLLLEPPSQPDKVAAHDGTKVFRRVLVVASLKYMLQVSADVILQAAAGGGDGADAAVLSPILGQFVRALNLQDLQHAPDWQADGHQPPVPLALATLPSPVHRNLLFLFLRQLSKNGVERDAARRALAADKARSQGKFLPQCFHELVPVRRFCAPPATQEVPTAFALHPGYATSARALQLALTGEKADEEEALRLLQGNSDEHHMPEGIPARQLAVALAFVQKAQATKDEAQWDRLLRFLRSVPYMGLELPLTEAVRALLDPGSIVPKPIRDWFHDESSGQLAQAVLHVVMLLALDNGASPQLAMFHELIKANGGMAVLDGAHVPANVKSIWLRYMQQFPPAYHVYSCPNRHMYVTGECENIASQGLCAECGARIGGPAYGQRHAGNQYHGMIHQVMAEWDTRWSAIFANHLGFHAEARDANLTERGLPAPLFRCIRFVIEAALLGHGLLSGNDKFGALSFQQLVEQLQNEVNSIKDCLFPASADSTPAVNYLHAMVIELFQGQQRDVPRSWPLDAATCAGFEEAMHRRLRPFLGRQPPDVARHVQDAIDGLQAAASKDEVLEEVKRTDEFLRKCQPLTLETPQSLHWIPSPALTMDAFWTFISRDPIRAPVLHFLHSKESSLVVAGMLGDGVDLPRLSLLRYLPAIAHFLRLLFASCHLKISRGDAQVAFGKWLGQIGSSAPAFAEELRKAQAPFEAGVRAVWPHVHRHPLNPCIDYDDPKSAAHAFRNLHEKPVDELPLEWLLPSEEGPAMALFGTLSAWQRDILSDPCLKEFSERHGQQRLIPSLEARPFACTHADVVQFSSAHDVWPHLHWYVTRYLGGTSRDTIEFDDTRTFEQVIIERTRLLQKPLLLERLPTIQYLDEMAQSSVLASLDDRVGLTQELRLPAGADMALQRLSEQDPGSCGHLRSYALLLAALAVQAATRVDQSITDFVRAGVGFLLDSSQHRAHAILERMPQLSELRLSHLRALSAACWDGQVHQQFAQKPTSEQQEQIDAGFAEACKQNGPVLTLLSAALRRVGSEQFSYAQNWPEYIDNHAGEKIPNPKLVCPGGSIFYSVLEPVLLGELDDIPEHFAEVPITCFAAVLEAADGRAARAHSCAAGLDARVPCLSSAAYFQEDFEQAATEGGDATQWGGCPPVDPGPAASAAAGPAGSTSSFPSKTVDPVFGSGGSPAASLGVGLTSLADEAEEALRRRVEMFDRELVQTPKDGSCFFHAVRLAGLFSTGEAISALEMRQQALARASPEYLEVAAQDQGMGVEEYRKNMAESTFWADELMVGMVSIVQEKAVTVISPTYERTWYPSGVSREGVDDEAVWVAYNGSNHYYGVASISQKSASQEAASASCAGEEPSAGGTAEAEGVQAPVAEGAPAGSADMAHT